MCPLHTRCVTHWSLSVCLSVRLSHAQLSLEENVVESASIELERSRYFVEEYIYRLCFSQNRYPPLFFHRGEREAV